MALKRQLALGLLPKTENWHIYLLAADWYQGVYQLRPQDFRLKHAARVLKQVQKDCNNI